MASIVEITPNSALLGHAMALWRAESATLGFMPKGGFDQAAENQTLLGALESDGSLLAYTLYRNTNDGLRIAHLCVHPQARGRKIAQALVQELSRRHPDASGIGLWCRRDFAANDMWPKLGFTARTYRRGRGRHGDELVFWGRDHGHEDLFSSRPNDQRVEAVIDTSVFFDIADQNMAPEREESHALNSDWLNDSIRLLVSPEIRNDIHRDSDALRSERHRQQLGGFQELRLSAAKVDAVLAQLTQILPPAQDAQTSGDYRHLAQTIAGGIPYFITRDRGILQKRPLLKPLGVDVLSPGEFIRGIDALERTEVYRPEEIPGTRLTFFNVDANLMDKVEFLADTPSGESPSALGVKVRTLLANPRTHRARLVLSADQEPLALIGEEGIDSSTPKISLVRLENSNIAPTLARFVVYKLITEAAAGSWTTLSAEDTLMPEAFAYALKHCGFQENESKGFVRKCGKGLCDTTSAATAFDNLPPCPIERESLVWPAKITDIEVPAYMISIDPAFASNLFDHSLASQELFCQKPHVLMQDECVYYSSTNNALKHPGRILWYVSKGVGFEGTSAVRACSFFIEAIRGPAKDIYRKFKRFGVFDWAEILKIAGSPEGLVTALRFSHTEAFPQPIPLSELLPDIGSAPVGPRPIPHEKFLRLYSRGMGL